MKAWGAVLLGVLAAAPSLANAARPGVMEAAPQVALPSLDPQGGGLDLHALRGRVVYIDFWASWCASCVISLPALDRLKADYAGRSFALVSVDADANRAAGQAFLHRFALAGPIGWDPKGLTLAAYGVGGLPSGVLIDANGLIRARTVGYQPNQMAALRETINQLLREQALGIRRRPAE